MVDRTAVRRHEAHGLGTAIVEHIRGINAQQLVSADLSANGKENRWRACAFEIVEAPPLQRDGYIAEVYELNPLYIVEKSDSGDLVEANSW
jgi:hypothetical protein